MATRAAMTLASIDVSTYNLAASMDVPPGVDPSVYRPSNLAKWLLWEDPLLRHLSGQLEHAGLPLMEVANYYGELSQKLSQRVGVRNN